MDVFVFKLFLLNCYSCLGLKETRRVIIICYFCLGLRETHGLLKLLVVCWIEIDPLSLSD